MLFGRVLAADCARLHTYLDEARPIGCLISIVNIVEAYTDEYVDSVHHLGGVEAVHKLGLVVPK